MSLPSIFDLCVPREDVRSGGITESDFAADLAQVLRGEGPAVYRDAGEFFANSHPTRGLKDLLRNVCLRLQGSSEQAASIFRLDTNYGGGKTHALIALSHLARGAGQVPNVGEFVDRALLPAGTVRIAAFDGENADPSNGRPLGEGVRAYTPWGELAFALAGRAGYERVQRSDEEGGAPGADTLRELFGGEPTLILLDELAVYLRKLKAHERQQAGGQLTAFLTGLFKAVESSPRAALVYTLAIGKGGTAIDAYSAENRFIADCMAEAESVSARKAALLDPTEEDETVKVLRRRLFVEVDDARAADVIAAYQRLWDSHREHLPVYGATDKRLDLFRNGFPLHPELIDTLREKTSTLDNFQRVRGMLRLLARTVARMWAERPQDAHAIHLHHVDPGYEPIRQEIVTRLGQRALVPAIKADVAAVEGDQPALAQELDAQHYAGMPPYASYVARVILFHTLAYNEPLKGAAREEVRYAILSPGLDPSFIDDAIRRLVQTSAYLDDRPNVPLRFLTEANLTQMVRRQEQTVDRGEVRVQLNDRIKAIFGGQVFQTVPFPGGPYDLPDGTTDGRPILALLGYDAVEIDTDRVALPELVARLYRYKGASGDLRLNRNDVVFLVVDAARREEMSRQMVRRLALDELRRPERIKDLAEHQRDRLLEWYRRSEQEVALAIQQAYRHLFYPSRVRLEGAEEDLAHTAIDVQNASANPGDGQQQVIRVLREVNKLRLPDDPPDSATYIRDRTPLKKGRITTAALRAEFRRDPALPVLVGDDAFIKGIRQGIEAGEYVYQSGDLVWGKGDPWATVKLDEQSFVYTAAYAREQGIWPRVARPPEPPGPGPGAGPTPPGPGPGPGTGTGPKPTPPEPPPPGARSVSAEGVLKEALTRLWEQARSKRFERVTRLDLRLFDAGDAFKLLGPVGAVPKAEKDVYLNGTYATAEGSTFEFTFQGKASDAQPVKDFLDPQLRAAAEKEVSATFTLRFTDGLPLAGEEPEKLTERLSRFGAGAAYVTATAEDTP